MAGGGVGAAGGDYSVMIHPKELVAAALPLQDHWLPLSNLDLLLPPLAVSVFFCYEKPGKCNGGLGFTSMMRTLKKSLAQTLVTFYAFAGEVVKNSVGEPELLCNNRGVDFMEAYADVELRELQLSNPDASVEGKLVPKMKDGVLSIQVTELRCGAVVVACTFDHRIADAYSGNMFLVAWAEMTQLKPISLHPSFRRSILNPRRPGSCDSSLDDMYVPVSMLPPPTAQPDPILSRIYYITAESIARLQALASSDRCRRTKLESLGAYLWQIVAKSDINDPTRRWSKMGVVVDGRMRLSDGKNKNSMAGYFGNVLSIPYGKKRVEELVGKPLSWVADSVHEYVKAATCKEHFLGLIDWVEAHRPEPALAKIYYGGIEEGSSAFVLSSGQRFPVGKMDFGWGRPVFGSYHFPWGGEAGYVMPMPSATREGDWVVYVHLLEGQIQVLEKEAGDVFRPLTPEYLGLHGGDADKFWRKK